jgi:hypothetical protein
MNRTSPRRRPPKVRRHAEAMPDRQGDQLIDGVAAGAPVRQLLLVEPLWHPRVPFTELRADHHAGI